MKILLIDNYDSFSFNLIELLRNLNCNDVDIIKNDQPELFSNQYDCVIVSPGPGLPHESGKLMEALEYHIDRAKPVFGVCLGLQALVELFGGTLRQLETVYHGIQESINIQEDSFLYKGMGKDLTIGRYHSWVADIVPPDFIVTSRTSSGVVMSIEHKSMPICAVQYHPESYMTSSGEFLVQNFLQNVEELKNLKV